MRPSSIDRSNVGKTVFSSALQVSEGKAEEIREEPEGGQHLVAQQSGQTTKDRDGAVCVGRADERKREGQTLPPRPAAAEGKHGGLPSDHTFADQEKLQSAGQTIQIVQTGK